MDKVTFGARAFLYPLPVIVVGTMISGRANFMTCAFCGIAQMRTPMLMITLGKRHHTNTGIKDARCFSANIPRRDMVEVVDYCGIVSGREVDKSRFFTVKRGSTGAPLADECPVNIECRLVDVLDYEGTNEIFLGEIVEVHVSADSLDEQGRPDLAKIDPLLFTMPDNRYWSVGEVVAKAWNVGKGIDPTAKTPSWVNEV
jgi:flavin reductase (DIM6/NTAB) family NADH-FMN oxidoreductase RutF